MKKYYLFKITTYINSPFKLYFNSRFDIINNEDNNHGPFGCLIGIC
jgi:hypothetical protein